VVDRPKPFNRDTLEQAFGSNAPEIMDTRANEHAGAGEIESCDVWCRVTNAVREILNAVIP